MNNTQYKELTKAKKIIDPQVKMNSLDALGKEIVAKLHAKLFNHKFVSPCGSCGSKWMEFIADLNKAYDAYTPIKRKGKNEAANEGAATRKAG